MKCVCGFEERELKHEDDVLRVDEKFHKITSQSFTINMKQGEWDHDRIEVKGIYSCPECGTLKINLD